MDSDAFPVFYRDSDSAANSVTYCNRHVDPDSYAEAKRVAIANAKRESDRFTKSKCKRYGDRNGYTNRHS